MRLSGPPPPAPLSIAQLKAHARLDHSHEDATLERMLAAALTTVERGAHRFLSPRQAVFTVKRRFSQWWFPVAPVRALTSVRILRADGTDEPISGLVLLQGYDEPRLVRTGAFVWPSFAFGDLIEIEAETGFDPADDRAAPLLNAVLMLAAWRIRQREAASEESLRPVPFGLQSDLRQHRYLRPCEMEP